MDLYLGQMKDIILGQDFLTWLWYKTEQTGGRFATAQGVEFECHVEQRISVQGGEGENVETATVSGPTSKLKEARLGLATGKKVSRMLLRVELGELEVWRATLKAEDLTLSGLRTPKVEAKQEEGDDPDAVFYEKVFLIQRFVGFVDELFAQFLALRFGPQWTEEEKLVRIWVSKQES